jgi:hypothetical protein
VTSYNIYNCHHFYHGARIAQTVQRRGYGLDIPRFNSQKGKEIFSLPTNVLTGFGPYPIYYSMGTRGSGHKPDHSPPPTAVLKNEKN